MLGVERDWHERNDREIDCLIRELREDRASLDALKEGLEKARIGHPGGIDVVEGRVRVGEPMNGHWEGFDVPAHILIPYIEAAIVQKQKGIASHKAEIVKRVRASA